MSNDTINITKDYYDSSDADNFYFNIWGGEDIHIGLYDTEDEDIFSASRKTVRKMASLIEGITEETNVLDLGAGYGGSARYLAKRFGCRVTALNLSPVQNQRNREMNEKAGLTGLIDVIDGNFEQVPLSGGQFDVIWSQDAFLHSSRKEVIFDEISRLLKPSGQIVFTDPMQKEGVSKEALQPVLDRIHLNSMASFEFYQNEARKHGFSVVQVIDLSEHLGRHYQRVYEELQKRECSDKNISEICSDTYRQNMKKGLKHWVDAHASGNLTWGIMHFRKSS